MTGKFKLDDVVTRTEGSAIPANAQGVVLGAAFDHYGEVMYPVKWFGHPNTEPGKRQCTLSDCATRDHWHSRERMLIKVQERTR